MNVVHPRFVFFLHHFTFFTSSLMPCFLPSVFLHIIQLASSKSVLTVVLFHPFFLEVCSVIVCNFFLYFLLISVPPFSSFCISQVFTPFVSLWQMPNWMMNVLLLCSNWTAVFFLLLLFLDWLVLMQLGLSDWTSTSLRGFGGMVLVGFPLLPVSGGWWEGQCYSPSVSSHTLTQTHTNNSDEQPTHTLTSSCILTSHTREWCGCDRLHMLLWILINYANGHCSRARY